MRQNSTRPQEKTEGTAGSIFVDAANRTGFADSNTIIYGHHMKDGPCEGFNGYLEKCVERSEFRADVELDEEGRYVLLSICEYMFDDARYVLHGMLVP